MKTLHLTVCGLLLASFASHSALGSVLNMGGTRNADGSWTGLASLETVPVGNANNVGELSGAGAGGTGPDRICGAASYDYRIGRYEVTAGQYCEFLNAVAKTNTYGLYNPEMWSNTYGCKIQRNGTSGSYTYAVASDYANRPVNYVSFGDACRFANWLHNGQPSGAQDATTTEDGAYCLNGATSNSTLLALTRKSDWKWAVTSEDEWYKAAYYNPATSSYYDYPMSSNSLPGRDLNDASGNNANYYGGGLPIQSPYYMTVVGEFQNSDSPYGTFDQGGNVWEWNEAVPYGGSRGVRGGPFDDNYYYLLSVRFVPLQLLPDVRVPRLRVSSRPGSRAYDSSGTGPGRRVDRPSSPGLIDRLHFQYNRGRCPRGWRPFAFA